jgi:hypothetical protein
MYELHTEHDFSALPQQIDIGSPASLLAILITDEHQVTRQAPMARKAKLPASHYEEYSGPRPPHGAHAAMTSNGLCDHTRASPGL